MQRREQIRLKNRDNLPNIYLLGFMGTGKTSIGKRLARKLNFAFIDSDCEIERQQSMQIKEIFSLYGEEKFRQLERDFIENGHQKNNCVVSCGGGLVCRDDMPELVKSKGVSVVLFSTPQEIFERTSKNNKRPLLNVENPLERIKELLKERTPFYMRSGVSIATEKDINKTVEHVLRIYYRKIRQKERAG